MSSAKAIRDFVNWRDPRYTSTSTYPYKEKIDNAKKEAVKKQEKKQVHYDGPWYPLQEWVSHYRCELCKGSLKGKSPQRVFCCLSLYCAECINTHYNVKRELKCPCCKEFLSPKDEPECCTDGNCREYREPDDYEESFCPSCREVYCMCGADEEDDYEDDGTLGCGCIDVCRGRCGGGYGYLF